MHLIKKKKNLPSRLHIRPHRAGSTLSELHFLYFLFHCGKVGLVVVRRCKQQHPPWLSSSPLSSAPLCSSPAPNVCSFGGARYSFHCIFNLFMFFFSLRQEVQSHRSNGPSLARPFPPSGWTGRQRQPSFFLSLPFFPANLPPSVLPDGGQCGRSLVQRRECSPELTISPRLPECR